MLALTEEQTMVRAAARDFVSGRSSLKRARAGGFDRGFWREMARLGWLDALGAIERMLVCEELGRGLVPESLVPALLGAAALGQDDIGERLVALAYLEPGARFDPTRVETHESGGRLHGRKVFVLGGASADAYVVSATGGLFRVAAGAPGLTVEPLQLLDGRDAAQLTLDSTPGERLEGGAARLARVLDRGAIALAAEMVGSMEAAFQMTLAYLKSRVQFGVAIGSFQALQHRAAKLFVEIELARSAVWRASALLDEGADDATVARAASVAKAKCSDAFLLVAHEAIQMHGGIGMTDEHDIGLFLKRARVAEMTLGDARYHRDRFARLQGF
jgi:alkylation response protein AidB-like acyl-CoA dehydrogenase